MHPIHDNTTTHVRTFSDQLLLFRRRWAVVLLPVALGATLLYGLGLDKGPTTYEATATLIANPIRSGGTNYQAAQVAVIATSDVVRSRAIAILGGHPPCGVSASAKVDVGTVVIKATGTDREGCGRTAQAFTDALQAALIADDQAAGQQAIDDAKAELDKATTELADLQLRLSADPNNPVLQAQQQGASNRYNDASSTVNDAEKREQATSVPLLRLLTPPTASVTSPSGLAGLSARSRVLLGGALGFILGFALAVVLEGLDRRIRTVDQATKAFDAPTLAEIPRVRKLSTDGVTDVNSEVMDAYRRLRTVVMLSRSTHESRHPERRGHVVLVVSPGPGEGKTTTVAHLAAALAESGLWVLAVGADLRKPQLERLLPSSNGVEPVDGASPIDQWTPHQTIVAGVDLLAPRVDAESGAQTVRKIEQYVELARRRYEVILIDTPPVLVANDALDLVPISDDVLFVVRFGQTREAAAQRAAQQVHNVDGAILGSVLTSVKRGSGYGYYYGRSYDSYRYDKSKPKRKKR